MDYMEKITDLRARKKDLKDQAANLVEEDKLDDATALADQMETINKQIAGWRPWPRPAVRAPTPSMTACCTTARASPGTAGRTPPSPSPPWGSS